MRLGTSSITLSALTRDDDPSDHHAVLAVESPEIAGPFDLRATVKSGQTAMPEWLARNNAYMDLVEVGNQHIAFRLRQTSGPFHPRLGLELLGPSALSKNQIQEARERFILALDLNRDLDAFYRAFDGDVLVDAFDSFPGLRVMRAWDDFEALTSCMLTQWSSVKGWNTVARRLRRRFGMPVRMSDGSVWYSSPTAASIAEAGMKNLRACGTGFRARYLKDAARLVVDGEISLKDIRESPYLDAKEQLMEIPGVGTKVADCLLLYGFGMMEAAPVDVWMHRVIRRLYLSDQRINQRKAEDFMREHFGSWAGYAQLYLYHYARMKHIL